MPERDRRSTVLSLIALLMPLTACSGAAAADPGACVVAEIGGHAVTTADVEALRGHVDPAPDPAAATRYAIEAALAHWDEHGELAGATPRQRMAAHELLLLRAKAEGGSPREVAMRARDQLRDAATRAGVRPGPCHPDDTPAAG